MLSSKSVVKFILCEVSYGTSTKRVKDKLLVQTILTHKEGSKELLEIYLILSVFRLIISLIALLK